MAIFNKLKGYRRTPCGQERVVLKWLPRILLVGTVLLALPSLGMRWWWSGSQDAEVLTRIMTVDIYMIGFVILHWTAVLTVGIGALIVMVMKGPAYVADAYWMDEAPEDDGADGGSSRALDEEDDRSSARWSDRR
jgi:hypothetical protein